MRLPSRSAPLCPLTFGAGPAAAAEKCRPHAAQSAAQTRKPAGATARTWPHGSAHTTKRSAACGPLPPVSHRHAHRALQLATLSCTSGAHQVFLRRRAHGDAKCYWLRAVLTAPLHAHPTSLYPHCPHRRARCSRAVSTASDMPHAVCRLPPRLLPTAAAAHITRCAPPLAPAGAALPWSRRRRWRSVHLWAPHEGLAARPHAAMRAKRHAGN